MMKAEAAGLRLFGLLIGAALVLGACGHRRGDVGASDDEINVYPAANYKSEIAGAMHAYLNDPTGIRDAGISEPAKKTVGKFTRYVVCVQYNAKRKNGDYGGVKEVVAVFLAGRFDQFIEPVRETREVCVGAAYTPFPELQNLSR